MNQAHHNTGQYKILLSMFWLTELLLFICDLHKEEMGPEPCVPSKLGAPGTLQGGMMSRHFMFIGACGDVLGISRQPDGHLFLNSEIK